MDEAINKMVAMKISEVEAAVRDAYRTAEANIPVMEDENLRFHFIGKEFRKRLVDIEFHYVRFFLSLFENDLERTFKIKISDLLNIMKMEETSIEIQFGNKQTVPAPKVERKPKTSQHDRSHIHNTIHYITIQYELNRRSLVSMLTKLFDASDSSAHNWIGEMLRAGTLKLMNDAYFVSSFKEVPNIIDLKLRKRIDEHIGTLLEEKTQLVLCAFESTNGEITFEECKDVISKKSLNAMYDIFTCIDDKIVLTAFGKKAHEQMTPFVG